MDSSIIVALVTGGFTFAGVLISNLSGHRKMVNDIKLEITAYHASTDEKIKALTDEVKKHNNFAQRMPKLEERVESISEKIDYLHR